MKRMFVVAFIVGYLCLLTFGNVCHLLNHGSTSHSLMYMIVWDMFCGWAAYDSRVRIIAESENETYYDLTEAPWGEIHAFGYIGRENYDPFNLHSREVALNVLKHTAHEPISRILVIEESWPKKNNLPDAVWNMRYDVPKDKHVYYRVRQEILPDGTVTKRFSSFLEYHTQRQAVDNPRLVQQSRAEMPMFLSEGPGAVGRGELLGPESSSVGVFGPSAN